MSLKSIAALIVAAGRGARFGGETPKQHQLLAGLSPLSRTLMTFHRHPDIDRIACVVAPGGLEDLKAARFADVIDVVAEGGATRQASVRAGLEAMAADSPPDAVLIHDAARPLIPLPVIDRAIAALAHADGAAPALPAVDTLSYTSDDVFADEVASDGMVRRQTPQAFRFREILAAHRRVAGQEATDDIAIARMAGLTNKVIDGDHRLHKLTTPEDRALLEAMILAGGRGRVGNGFDVHRFGPGDSVMLCGVSIPFEKSLVGHSDADVALHALTDAMLGAVGAGDIGLLFPPSDPQWKGAASHIFLTRALAEIADRGAELENVDVTIICERPKVGPHRQAMTMRLAELLHIDAERINVKATTTETLGFTGRGEGIAAMASVSVWAPA